MSPSLAVVFSASGDAFSSVALVLAAAAVMAYLAHRAHQPLIVAFIAVGILVGPSVFGWVNQSEPLELFAEIGIAVLLFLVGLKLDFALVRSTGRIALLTGLGQIFFTATIGFALALLLGMSATVAMYVAVALTFSSTIIIVKLLSDKRELDKLYGRIALGCLIVQDIVVVIVMITVSSLSAEGGSNLGLQLLRMGATALGLLIGMWVLMRFLLPRVMKLVASSQELLIVSAMAWAVSMAALSDWLGFSVEVGAFLAGFAIASTPYRESVAASLSGLRDFLLLFFFIQLGAQLNFSELGSQVPAAIVLSIFVIVGKPIIMLAIMGMMRYPRRVSFLSGVVVAQISEFSLILIALAQQLGHVENEAVGLVTLVGLITIGISTYMINYSHRLFEVFKSKLGVFERRQLISEADPVIEESDFIVYGYGRFGRHLVEHLASSGHTVMVVDWNPYARIHVSDPSVSSRIRLVFGDADDPEFPGTLPLDGAKWIVSTINAVDTNRVVAESLRRWSSTAKIAVTALSISDHVRLQAGVDRGVIDLILQPFDDAADDAIAAMARDD